MTRDLSSDQLNNLATPVFISETLIAIDESTIGFQLFYTTGPYEVTLYTPQTGTRTFKPDNRIQVISDISQQSFLSDNRAQLIFSKDENFADIDPENWPFRTTDVFVYKHFRDPADNLSSTAVPILTYRGSLCGKKIKADESEYTIQLDFSSEEFVNQRVANYPTALRQLLGL